MSPGRQSRADGQTSPASNVDVASNITTASVSLDGIDRAIENASSDWWYVGALLYVRQIAQMGQGFTADDLLDAVGQPPAPEYVGAVFAAAYRSKLIEPVGCRVASDNRLVRVWWAVSP